LRTFYLRLTGRPHGAWMASCISMHLVEASGLHKEMQTIAVVYVSGNCPLGRDRSSLTEEACCAHWRPQISKDPTETLLDRTCSEYHTFLRGGPNTSLFRRGDHQEVRF
jgi:hypothetical protein